MNLFYFFARFAGVNLLFLFLVFTAYSQNWTQLSNPNNYLINSCWFDETNPDNGWFVGWRLAGADPVSYGYKTTNGGNSLAYTSFNYYFWLAQDVNFVNSNNGVAVGSGIIKTNNGGNTWNVTVDNIQMAGTMYDVMFNSASTGYAVGQTYDNSYSSYWGVIYKTSDGGESWSSSVITEELQNQNTEFRAVYSTAPGIIYAGGLNTYSTNSLFKSTDNGLSWAALNFYHDVNSIWFADETTGIIAFENGLYKTTDAGITWANILSTSSTLHSISMKNNYGFAVGANGTIFKTTNTGLSWAPMTSPVNNQLLKKVFQVSNSIAYAVGTNGTILKYQDFMVGVQGTSEMQTDFQLNQNYPNPFNPVTNIKFEISKNSSIKLEVFNTEGKLIKTLANGEFKKGSYEAKWDALNSGSGIYFCRLSASDGSFSKTLKMMLIK